MQKTKQLQNKNPKKKELFLQKKQKPGEKTQSNRLKRNVQRETETKTKNKTSINQQNNKTTNKHNKHTIHIHTYTYIIHKHKHIHKKCTYFPIVHTNQEIV